jgi:hypothetical protein
MGEVVRTTRKQSLQAAGIVAGTALTLNALFFAMSGMYFDDKPQLAADLGSVRTAFAVMSLLIAATSYAAGLAPRLVGHGLSTVIGAAAVAGGLAGFASSLPIVMSVTLIITGALLVTLVVYSLKGSRPAWSFLISMLAVLATVTFFGAPKIRHVLDIGLWTALIIPGLQVVAVIALVMIRGEYKNR